MKKLNEKHKRFIDEYVKDLNGAAAAQRAGYSVSGSRVRALRILRTPQAQAYLKQVQKERAERTQIDADYTLGLIKKTADHCSELVEKIDADGNRVMKMRNATAALRATDQLMRHLGLYNDKLAHSGPNGGPLAPPVINIGFSNGGPGDSCAEGS